MDNLLLTTEPFLTGEPLKVWLDNVGVRDWSINSDGFVNVEKDVDLTGRLGELKRLPVRFGIVGGDFYCQNNQLVSLEGAPKKVGGIFSCGNNQLVSLEGGPKEVGRGFYCNHNRLVNLEGAPKNVGGSFSCTRNQLVSLEGAPKLVGGDFSCGINHLVDFKGMAGVSIEGSLIVTNQEHSAGPDNVFVSMEGLPKELYGKVLDLDIQDLLVLEAQHSGIPDIEI